MKGRTEYKINTALNKLWHGAIASVFLLSFGIFSTISVYCYHKQKELIFENPKIESVSQLEDAIESVKIESLRDFAIKEKYKLYLEDSGLQDKFEKYKKLKVHKFSALFPAFLSLGLAGWQRVEYKDHKEEIESSKRYNQAQGRW